MQARQIGRPNPTSQARLQLLLLLLAIYNFLTFLLELTNTRLLQIGDIDGVLGGRAISGSTAVLAVAYLYAARNPVRYRFIIWLALIEQFVAMFAATFHWARDDIGFGEAIAPIGIAVLFLLLLMANLPRQTDTL